MPAHTVSAESVSRRFTSISCSVEVDYVPIMYLREADLVRDVTSLLPEFLRLKQSRCTTHLEVGVGRSIADVVVLILPERFSAPKGVQLTVEESVAIFLLRATSHKSGHGVQPDSLPSVPERVWIGLAAKGVVRFKRSGAVVLTLGWLRSAKMVAIEAKLTRWRDALRQAREYRKYADRVFVALPESEARKARMALEAFTAAGVGLLGVDERLRPAIRAPRSCDHDWRRAFVLSRLVHKAAVHA
jgi:hypothetical protein